MRIFKTSFYIYQSTFKKGKINRRCVFAVTSYPTVTAHHWIRSMVAGEFWKNIYAKPGKFLDKIVNECNTRRTVSITSVLCKWNIIWSKMYDNKNSIIMINSMCTHYSCYQWVHIFAITWIFLEMKWKANFQCLRKYNVNQNSCRM